MMYEGEAAGVRLWYVCQTMRQHKEVRAVYRCIGGSGVGVAVAGAVVRNCANSITVGQIQRPDSRKMSESRKGRRKSRGVK